MRKSAAARGCRERERGEDSLLSRVRDLLAPAAAPHCTAARVSDGVLVLTADAPAWATRIRYQGAELLTGLEGRELREVRVQTRPAPDPEPQRRRTGGRALRLSPAAAEHLLAAAEGCADPVIGEIFRRIAYRRGSASPTIDEV